MPIYEYQCAKCGEIFEAFQKITDQPLSECRFCGGKVEKLISHSSFQLKGSGWYLTDYARKSSSPGTTSSSSEGSKTESKAGAPGGEKSSTTSKPEKNST